MGYFQLHMSRALQLTNKFLGQYKDSWLIPECFSELSGHDGVPASGERAHGAAQNCIRGQRVW